MRHLGFAFVCAAALAADPAVDSKVFERLEWRSIGPATMGGRITDIEGAPGNPNLVYVATASGGLWKTVNGGVNWTPIFERQGTISIGDIALEPGNPEVIWVGTGEASLRNSVSFGDGVYRSTDGGKTWQHLGLEDTRHISRIVVSPRDPNTVYVGAFGHAWGENEERGVFMTTDGGKTWQKTLYIDASHGVSDLDIDPSNPNVLYAAMWHFVRKPWTFESGDEKGGVFKSIDGGRTWKKLEKGLPRLMGRIGVKVAPSDSKVVYVIAESQQGTLFRSDDAGESFRQVSKQENLVGRGFYYAQVAVDPKDENRVYAVASPLFVSIDGGRAFRRIATRVHVDFHALWIDPKEPSRIWEGSDGGLAVSYDRGENWEVVNNIPLGQFYQVFADDSAPFYNLVGGLQDNGTWTGPSRTRARAGIFNDDWRMVSFGDGFHALISRDDPELFLTESQSGSIARTSMRTGEQQRVTPQPLGQGGGPASAAKYRFNWNAPIVLSPHNKDTVYFGSNVVFRSTDFGATWQAISPDLTTNDPSKLKDAGGPVWIEDTSAEYHCTIISLAESPARAGVIWAGTDDGNVQVTTDGGKSWNNVAKNVPGLAPNSPVSHIEPSRTSADVAYASFDRHMLDDLRPYVYKTSDGGRQWANIAGNLPKTAYVWVVREDPRNPRLLYAGTELGLYASYTGGESWVPLAMKNLPSVAVHDIAIQPRENDIVLATHGRSFFILDDAAPVQQMSPQVIESAAHVFEIRPAWRFATPFSRYGVGNKLFAGPNPPYGAIVTYYLKEKPADKTPVRVEVLDAGGKVIRDIKNPPKEQGLNRVAWDLRYETPRLRRPPSEEETEFRGGPRGPLALPGTYRVRLSIGDQSQEKPVEVKLDPGVSVSMTDLKMQLQQGLRLRDMLSAANDALKSLDSIREQLRQIQKTVKDQMPDAPKELTTLLADNLKHTDSLADDIARDRDAPRTPGTKLEARLAERINNLYSSIDGPDAAPTAPQSEAILVLEKEYRERMTQINAFLAGGVSKLNDSLRKYNAGAVLVGKPAK